ncbi:MAG: DUF6323 family protein [Oscillospiraceae bacterium]
MADDFFLEPLKMQQLAAAQELRDCNDFTAQFGLRLSEPQVQTLVAARFEALKATGRMELGEGILKKLIIAFCDSPYLTQENYEDTLLGLQESFYYFKNESEDRIPDDDLIAILHRLFHGAAQGSIDYLSGTLLEDLCRNTRYGYATEDDGDRYASPFEARDERI